LITCPSDPDLASNPGLQNYTMQLLDLSQEQQMLKNQLDSITQRSIDLAQAQMIGLIVFVVSPFILSSVWILAIYIYEPHPDLQQKSGQ
jgi:hypothetical protein